MKCIKVTLIVGYMLIFANWANGQVSKTEKRLVKYIDQHNNEALQLLEEIININSGTMNFDGVKAVADVLMPKFKALGMEVEWKDGSAWNRAGHLVARTKGGKGKKILLIGHLDTVFELESPFQKYKVLNDTTASGPGIADMKGGDIIILQALSALNNAGLLKDMSITVIMTGDEELSGDPLSLSKQELVEAAKWADIALGFENGDGNPGTANVARRSSSGWTLKVTGNAAHSSQVFKPEVGAGAIYETARILTEFYDALSKEEYLTFNPGMILGGTNVAYDESIDGGRATGKSNVVAKDAVVTGDIRTISPEQLQRTQKTMTEIVAKHLPKTNATISFDEGYPPFAPTEGNYELLKQLSKVSTDLGFMAVEPVNASNAGAADISFTSDYIEMGLDGLGMGGKNDHTVNETGDLKVLPMQTKRAAVLLYRLTR
ncbi:MAG: M20/M25/M40 family metallo-hydrolase [Imperialibacter sp.]|uniref:M20/M25/M40 family metallo-hydrolase n=1 Tax=Imperialibacter sp. TaxID=2038411 RepID=UPI0032EE0C2A